VASGCLPVGYQIASGWPRGGREGKPGRLFRPLHLTLIAQIGTEQAALGDLLLTICYDLRVALWWLCGGSVVAFEWLCAPESMPSICLVYGFEMALGGLPLKRQLEFTTDDN
jgi:hypothetical protein